MEQRRIQSVISRVRIMYTQKSVILYLHTGTVQTIWRFSHNSLNIIEQLGSYPSDIISNTSTRLKLRLL